MDVVNSILKSLSKVNVLKAVLGILAFVVVITVLTQFFPRGMKPVVMGELATIKAGTLQLAYDRTSKAFKDQTSFEQFQQFVETYPIVKNYVAVSFNEQHVDNDQSYLRGTIQGDNGTVLGIIFQLALENGHWKVQAIQLANPNLSANGSSDTLTKDGSKGTIYDILVNDTAESNGYVYKTKNILPKTAEKVFVTVEIAASDGKGIIQATLILPGGGKIGPIIGEITKPGNIMKAFAFSRTTAAWLPGEYSVVINLSSGASRTFKFEVK